MRIEAVHPGELGASEEAAWGRLLGANPTLASPYYSFGYAKAVGAARPDARIALIEDGGALCGFLGMQGAGRMAGMALGAPLSDYQGLIAADPAIAVDRGALCRALKVGRIDFTHLPQDQAGLASQYQGSNPSWVANVGGGKVAYLARMRQKRQETQRQQDRKRRKLEREIPDAVFAVGGANESHLQTLLDWKSDQCRRTGQPLVWAAPWVRSTVHHAFQADNPRFRGLLFTLTQGDRLIAGHYALVNGKVMHAWLLAHEQSFEAYSPGVLLTRFMVEWAADSGYAAVDFGIGDYRYKREFGEPAGALGWGYISGRSVAGLLRGLEFTGRGLVERLPFAAVAAAPGKLMRRLDVMRGLAAPNS